MVSEVKDWCVGGVEENGSVPVVEVMRRDTGSHTLTVSLPPGVDYHATIRGEYTH
jgi:hypothetical protein